jgi:hypothetical protein
MCAEKTVLKGTKKKGRKGANFSARTRETIARRAGLICSFPTCDARTTGPSAESEASHSDSGTACHIIAASPNPPARRRRSPGDNTDLSSAANGIWMCGSHGKIIDDDESTYTVALLRQWKHLSERKAHLAQILGQPKVDLSTDDEQSNALAPVHFEISVSRDLIDRVDEILSTACCYDVWGAPATLAIRELLTELILNAEEHGGARKVNISIEPTRILLSDDGDVFSLSSLSGHLGGKGGQLALKAIVRRFGSQLFLGHQYLEQGNVYTIAMVQSLSELRMVSPCVITLDYEAIVEDKASDPSSFPDCDVIYMTWNVTLSWSDIDEAVFYAGMIRKNGKKVVAVIGPVSEELEAYIRTYFQGDELVVMPKWRTVPPALGK